MGAATIISDLGAGQYTVRRDITGLDGELAMLAARRAQLETQLPILKNTVAMHWDDVQIARQTLNALMKQWINGTLPLNQPPDPTPPALPTPPITPTSDEKTEVLNLVNTIRTANGLDPLTANEALTTAAEAFAEDRGQANAGGHIGSDGSQPKDRIAAAGYPYVTCGENVAVGQQSPEEVVQAWMDSPAHRANILNPDYTQIGIGGGGSQTGKVWVQNFGTPA